MNKQALGLIETRGYQPLVTAVDAAIKAARVSLVTTRLVGGGLVNATVRGDVGAVRAALDAALATINQMGACGMTHVIARPDPAVWALLAGDGLKGSDPWEPENGPKGPAGPPAVRPEPEMPAHRVSPEVPAVKPDSDPPATRVEPEVPVVKPETGVPVIRNADQPPPPDPEVSVTADKKNDEPSASKTRGKVKKPRKSAKK